MLLCLASVVGFCHIASAYGQTVLTKIPYSQSEADQLVRLAKIIPSVNENRSVPLRLDSGEHGLTFPAYAQDDPNIKFQIEIHTSIARHETVYILKGRIGDRPLEGLLAYHIHNAPHKNPLGIEPMWILTTIPHKHVYNADAYAIRGVWCAVAYPLDNCPNPTALWANFIVAINATFNEPDAPGLFREVTQ
jgi:hypothetical protein